MAQRKNDSCKPLPLACRLGNALTMIDLIGVISNLHFAINCVRRAKAGNKQKAWPRQMMITNYLQGRSSLQIKQDALHVYGIPTELQRATFDQDPQTCAQIVTCSFLVPGTMYQMAAECLHNECRQSGDFRIDKSPRPRGNTSYVWKPWGVSAGVRSFGGGFANIFFGWVLETCAPIRRTHLDEALEKMASSQVQPEAMPTGQRKQAQRAGITLGQAKKSFLKGLFS